VVCKAEFEKSVTIVQSGKQLDNVQLGEIYNCLVKAVGKALLELEVVNLEAMLTGSELSLTVVRMMDRFEEFTKFLVTRNITFVEDACNDADAAVKPFGNEGEKLGYSMELAVMGHCSLSNPNSRRNVTDCQGCFKSALNYGMENWHGILTMLKCVNDYLSPDYELCAYDVVQGILEKPGAKE
jgi:hypothetical protein